jgi:hypothetical protein
VTDVVFFLKSVPNKAVRALPWPPDVKLIAVDPGPLRCTGVDPLCSSAYSRMWASLRDANGQVMPRFLAKYARGIDVGRVAFVGFSASHGLLNPLANNAADRARIDAYILLDATFGGGKTGYAKFVADAARGKHLFVTTTAHTGGDTAFAPVWAQAAQMAGKRPKQVEARPPMRTPSGGAWQLGSLAFLLRYKDAQGNSELPHWKQGHILAPLLDAYLIPYWKGELRGVPWWAWGAAGAVGIAAAGYLTVNALARR